MLLRGCIEGMASGGVAPLAGENHLGVYIHYLVDQVQ